MSSAEVKPGIHWIGVNDRTTDLFEGLWPISQEGVSYNTYLINDEKKALIDLVKSIKSDDFFDKIDEIVPVSEIDYVIINHMEPDHTGVLKILHKINPDVTIVGSAKMKEMLKAYYGITENVKVVADGDELDLGTKKLKFFSTPFVHWPETIMTYETTQKILFTCDAFGGYGALRGAIFDDEYEDLAFYKKEALRYYVNIVSNFSNPVLKAIDKVAGVDIDIIAPSHGLIWRDRPEQIVSLYKKWAGYASGPCETGVTLLYGSMYGNTESVMNAVSQGIAAADVPVEIFDVARTDSSYILPSLWVNSGVLVGAPTYEGKMFPAMTQVLTMASIKHIRNKETAYFGSFGWSKGALREMEALVSKMKWTMNDPYEFHGGVSREVLQQGREFGRRFAEHLKKNG